MSEQMKLSIIIPAYNAEPYLAELLDCLARQMREGVEVIVIDDGSEKKVTSKHTGWLRIIRQKNKGAGALTQNVPVLTCPFDSALEMGVKDGVNGYILPFDMKFDVNRLLNIPKFEYEYDNNKIIDQWKKLLRRKPKRVSGSMVKVRVEQPYKDLLLNRCLTRGYETYMTSNRANELKAKRLVSIIGGEE